MILFGGNDPTAQTLGSSNYQRDEILYFAQVPVNWQAQSSAHALLLNEAGRLVYGGAVMEYTLDAFTKTYGGSVMEYTLGLIVAVSIADTFNAASAFAMTADYGFAFGSSFAATGAMSVAKLLDVTMASSSAMTSQVSVNYDISVAITNALEALSGSGVEASDLTVWVFNANTFAPSRYEGLDITSITRLGTSVYGAGPGGLFELAGTTDNGAEIEASFIVGRADYGVPNVKRIAYGYVHGVSDDLLRVRIITDTGEVHSYDTERALGAKVRSARFKVGRGLKSHYWQFEVKNLNGQYFEIHHVGLLPAVLERWVKE